MYYDNFNYIIIISSKRIPWLVLILLLIDSDY